LKTVYLMRNRRRREFLVTTEQGQQFVRERIMGQLGRPITSTLAAEVLKKAAAGE